MCADNEMNSLSALFFSTPESSLRILLHDPESMFSVRTLSIFFVVYYLISCLTYGLAVPSGLFIPALLTGASWGRVIGVFVSTTMSRRLQYP